MRKLAILTFQSLDGVMQAPSVPGEDSSGGFTNGGWARDCWEEVMAQVQREAMDQPYDLLLGRKTYDSFASSFSNSEPENPVAARLNAAKKYVVCSSERELEWQNSEIICGDIPQQIAKLKQQGGPILQVHGSWKLIQTLLMHKLIDEFRLWTFPVIIGSGKRVFETGAVLESLKLIKNETNPSGATMSFYTSIASATA